MIILIDNYDSFTYNLVQCIGQLDQRYQMQVFRNDKVTIEQLDALGADHLIISPGPCTPLEAGISNQVISHFAGKVPILGVCLGHQCIGHVFGGKVVRAQRIMHGKTSQIEHNDKGIFAGIDNPFTATRYHSLIVQEDSLPDCFDITARTTDMGELMGLAHKTMPIQGVQFHPESFLTDQGYKILVNFLKT